jgi:exodeoxyribonuclease V
MTERPAKLEWSPQQDAALKSVKAWFDDPNAPQVFRVFGYAGTGKTTLAIEIANEVKGDEGVSRDVAFAAFTGKAALVMQSKGCAGASTIHSLIYRVDEDAPGVPRFMLNDESRLTEAKLCIIDECSMVGAEIAHDLLSFGVKVLVLGDPAQLPPVQDAGFFTNAEPDEMLTEVHRQARDNPIIRMSMEVRAGNRLPYGDFGACKVLARTALRDDPAIVLKADQLLVGMNATRTRYNARVRELKGITEPVLQGVVPIKMPVAGEKLVCLKNDRAKYLFNGGIWSVHKIRKANPAMIHMVIAPEDAGGIARKTDVKVHPYFFEGREGELHWEQIKKTQQFTFGYALTVHKSQGSQWDDVMLFDESGVFRDDARRWLYTGITRAAERLTVVM